MELFLHQLEQPSALHRSETLACGPTTAQEIDGMLPQ